jgi:hypothetical protein
MSGPAASLLAATSACSSESGCSLDDLATAAAQALLEGIEAGLFDEEGDTIMSDSACEA